LVTFSQGDTNEETKEDEDCEDGNRQIAPTEELGRTRVPPKRIENQIHCCVNAQAEKRLLKMTDEHQKAKDEAFRRTVRIQIEEQEKAHLENLKNNMGSLTNEEFVRLRQRLYGF
jgi:hypothetical protein